MTITVPVTVAMPTITPRVQNGMHHEATESVRRQTCPPEGGMSVALDVWKVGAALTRQRALDGVYTPWVAFLDDDDYLYPNHLEVLWDLVRSEDADVAYSWFDGNNPFPMHRGRKMDPANPHHTTMTLLVRTELARTVRFRTDHPEGWTLPQEDWRFITDCLAAGARFAGTGEVTWHYRAHGNNTSGLPTRW